MSDLIRTAHRARVRYDHGDSCDGCRALGPEAILRKLLTDPENGDQHYVDTDYGIIDVRVSFTPEEKEYLRGLREDRDG